MIVKQHYIERQDGIVTFFIPIEFQVVSRPDFLLTYSFDEAYSHYAPDTLQEMTALLFIAGWRLGENVINIEYSLCPELLQNIAGATKILSHWYPYLQEAPLISSEVKTPVPRQSDNSHAMQLISGGVDSLTSLWLNHIWYPKEHGKSIHCAVPVFFSQDFDAAAKQLDSAQNLHLRSIERCCDDIGVDCVPVSTNVWYLLNWGYFYDQVWHGALLTGSASVFCAQFNICYIAASFTGGYLFMPWGSHPMLDENYGSSRFSVKHSGVGLCRREKVEILTNWSVAMKNLRVCQSVKDGSSNCGRCEKCIRTMLALIACGKLEFCTAFRSDDISCTDLDSMLDLEYPHVSAEFDLQWYIELVDPLISIGRSDLAEKIQDIVRFYQEVNGRQFYSEKRYH